MSDRTANYSKTENQKPEEIRRDIVAAITDHDIDKYSLLELILEQSLFFQILDSEWKKSNKEKKDFIISVKPNLSMMIRKSDDGTYTDPFLVMHLLRLISYPC